MRCCGVGRSRVRRRARPATIEGTVVDQSGALLPGVTVTMTEADTGTQRVAVTDAERRFSAPLLAVGVYNLSAELAGFTDPEAGGDQGDDRPDR